MGKGKSSDSAAHEEEDYAGGEAYTEYDYCVSSCVDGPCPRTDFPDHSQERSQKKSGKYGVAEICRPFFGVPAKVAFGVEEAEVKS